MMFVWLLAVIFIIAYLLDDKKKIDITPSGKGALNILDEKFINGEITEEEYKTKKRLINE